MPLKGIYYIINTGFGSNGILSQFELWSWYMPTFDKKVEKLPNIWNVHLMFFKFPSYLKCSLGYLRGSQILEMYPCSLILEAFDVPFTVSSSIGLHGRNLKIK